MEEGLTPGTYVRETYLGLKSGKSEKNATTAGPPKNLSENVERVTLTPLEPAAATFWVQTTYVEEEFGSFIQQ